jgi:hypothetical protein
LPRSENHRVLAKACDDLFDAREEAEEEAARRSGKRRPIALVAWRHYSAIGRSEIERARNEFLRKPGTDPALIEKEYRSVKRQYRAVVRAQWRWDEQHGVAPLRRRLRLVQRQAKVAIDRVAQTKPTTASGCAARLMSRPISTGSMTGARTGIKPRSRPP